jgi:carboxyl-terminal processing protease
VTITRQEIEPPSLGWHMATPEVGYVHLERFTQKTDSELVAVLEELERAGASGLVLDLRGNTGGPLESATAVAARFLRENDVVLHQRRRGREQALKASAGGDVDLPLAVLIDGSTGRAAEVVAGAFQDHGRALLVGETSLGKGSVQEIHELSDGSSLHITAEVWLTPERHRIDNQGLTPDILALDGDAPGDEQLDRAVAYLESGL